MLFVQTTLSRSSQKLTKTVNNKILQVAKSSNTSLIQWNFLHTRSHCARQNWNFKIKSYHLTVQEKTTATYTSTSRVSLPCYVAPGHALWPSLGHQELVPGYLWTITYNRIWRSSRRRALRVEMIHFRAFISWKLTH